MRIRGDNDLGTVVDTQRLDYDRYKNPVTKLNKTP